MDKNIAIEFQNVGKQYRLGRVGTGTLQHDINRWWQTTILRKDDPYLQVGEVNDRSTKGNSEYVWALKDISFKVEQGDVVGIIGKNGAGKSTLLKLLSHITAPSTGDIFYKGRIASLLEVGTGFHSEMTGRENIYMNGSILGMTRQEIDRKLDEIVDFAGVERYIDTPVKRYSSGMTVRLGFAVAAFLEPEILVVDEVLTVGDAEFQKKAIGKMDSVAREGGRTVLFVSHNMTAVKNLCRNSILLENGMLKMSGETSEVVRHYLTQDNAIVGFDLRNISDFSGSGRVKVGKVEISSENEPNGLVLNNRPVKVKFEILNPSHCVGNLEVAGVIRNADRTYVLYFGSRLKKNIFKMPDREHFWVEVEFDKFPFAPQVYFLGIELSVNKEILFWKDEAIKFTIQDNDFYGTGDRWDKGIVLLNQDWKVCLE
jgi:lipopolysaccharide transport system ATP-binding protein